MSSLILTLDSGGTPHHWMKWQDAITLKYKGLVAWEYGDTSSVFHGGTSRMTGLVSEIEIAPIIAIRGKFKYDQRTPPLTNQNLFARDLNICGYCGRHFRVEKLNRDHIIPVSKGGKNTWTNCVTSCKVCNSDKADLTPEQAGMQLQYVPYVPSHVEKLILQNRKILADQMTFLAAMLPKHSRLLKNPLPIDTAYALS